MELSLIISLILVSLAIVACAVSVAMDDWYLATLHYDTGDTEVSLQYGLWHRCSNDTTPCDTWSEYYDRMDESVPLWLTITLVTMLVAAASMVLSLVCITVYGFITKNQFVVFILSAVFAYLGGISAVVGISVFGALHDQWLHQSGLYIGFGLGTASACIAFISTYFMFVLWRNRTIDIDS